MKHTEKRYHIKPEFLPQWGSHVDEDYIVTETELKQLASDWGKDEEELLEQLEEIR